MDKIERNETTNFRWELFESLCSNPVTTIDGIARMLDVSVDTLHKRVRDKYDMEMSAYREKKLEQFKASLFGKQWKVADEGSPALLIWLGKNYLGQTDKSEISIPKAEIVLKYANEL